MVVRRAIAILRRGTWDREVQGFVLSLDEKNCWYFTPDKEDEAGCESFFGSQARMRDPDRGKNFQPPRATVLHRETIQSALVQLKTAMEGLL